MTTDNPPASVPTPRTPITDDAFESYELRECGLKYVKDRMRDLERSSNHLRSKLERENAAMVAAFDNLSAASEQRARVSADMVQRGVDREAALSSANAELARLLNEAAFFAHYYSDRHPLWSNSDGEIKDPHGAHALVQSIAAHAATQKAGGA
jgi:hypothetical protein